MGQPSRTPPPQYTAIPRITTSIQQAYIQDADCATPNLLSHFPPHTPKHQRPSRVAIPSRYPRVWYPRCTAGLVFPQPYTESLQHRAADLGSLWIALGVRRSLDTYCTAQHARLCVAAKAYIRPVRCRPARGPSDSYQMRLSHVSPAHCLTARGAATRVLAASIADGTGLTPATLCADLCFEAAGC